VVLNMQFEHLFTPLKIGNKTARNRIIFPAHGIPTALPYCADEADGARYIAYQVARAKGGCAVNIIGPLGCYEPESRELSVFSPPTPKILIPKLHHMVEALHEHGALAIMQLFTYGKSFAIPATGTWGYATPTGQQEAVAEWMNIDEDELNARVNSFVKYAAVCQEGGMDGVEIHACHGDFVQQSWSKWANQRTDKWGEPMYFATQLIERIRKAVGRDFILSFKMTGDDLSFNGMDIKANQKIAQELEATGGVDLLNVSFSCGGASYAYLVGSTYIPPASISVPLASGIKQAVKSIPVAAMGRINDPALAENAIAGGHCDMVGLVRGQLADPEFGNKAREGRIEDIRLCIGCNQGCWDAGIEILRCTQNAVVSQESSRYGTITKALHKKKVVIVGGGPGGMEAARVAALRGHDVTLYEKEDQLGGQINILSKAPCREEFNQVTRFLITQINKLGVKIKLSTEANTETVKRDQPDAVVIATGARPHILTMPGSDQPNVTSPAQILKGEAVAGDKVVVFDTTGLQEAPTVADFLAEKGKKVELLTYFPSINAYWGLQTKMIGTHIPVVWPRLKRNGVIITPLATIEEISGRTVTTADVYSGEERIIQDVDTVVMATGYRSNNRLYLELKGNVKELYAIGDCALPRRALDAINDGYMKAFDI
jgi:2,4-dienoyl-CoA reductase-like NADH-dependent reductase (Old Yellow Enzyme family)/thioredoxin reductase